MHIDHKDKPFSKILIPYNKSRHKSRTKVGKSSSSLGVLDTLYIKIGSVVNAW